MKMMRYLPAAIVIALLVPGCTTVCSNLSGSAKEVCEALHKPKPEAPVDNAYVVTEGQRIEKVARSVEFDMTPARDGTQELEDVPVWAYAGTDPDAWGGGNHKGTMLSVRVKANNTSSYELKVGPTPNGVKEPDVVAPCKTGVKVHVKLELLETGVRLTIDGDSKFVEVPLSGDYTLGVGWPISKRQGCLGAKLENILWDGKP